VNVLGGKPEKEEGDIRFLDFRSYHKLRIPSTTLDAV
jgi:hypothetical protein